MAYERRIARQICRRYGDLYLVGPWIEFEDVNGKGFAQPDGILLMGGLAVVNEVKLTHTDLAFEELELLYGPLISTLLSRPVRLVETFKNWTKGGPTSNLHRPRQIASLGEALDLAPDEMGYLNLV